MSNPHPPPFSTGIDATDVDRFIRDSLQPAAKKVAEVAAGAVIDIVIGQIESYTPDQVDKFLDLLAGQLKVTLAEALK